MKKRKNGNERLSLLSQFKMLRHKRTNILTEMKPIPSEGRNFTIIVLQCLTKFMDQFRIDFIAAAQGTSSGEVDAETFVKILMHYLTRRDGQTVPVFSSDFSYNRVQSSLFPRKDIFGVAEDEVNLPPPRLAPSGMRSIEGFKDIEAEALLKDQLLLKKCLERMYLAVDVEDNNGVSWEELSEFMTNAAIQGPVQRQEYDFNMYQTSVMVERPKRPVQAIYNWPEIDRVAVLSQASKKVHQLPQSVIELHPRSSHSHFNTTNCELVWFEGNAVCAEYLPSHRSIIISSADLHLSLIDVRPEGILKGVYQELRAEDMYCAMKWSTQWGKLIAGSSNGNLSVWNIPADIAHNVCASAKKLYTHKTYESAVQKLDFLPLDGSIVSCSMDSRLVIQEPERMEVVCEMKGHQSAVRNFSYSNQHHALVTCGYDREILLWSLLSAGTPYFKPVTLYDKKEPHTPAIVSVHCVPNTPQMLSLDHAGLLKVWDLRTFGVVQNIHVGAHTATQSRDRDFYSLLPTVNDGIVCCTRKEMRSVIYTNISSTFDVSTCDDTIIALHYSMTSSVLITTTQTSIQTWELLSGVCSGHFKVSDRYGEVTSSCLDCMGRKVYVGHRSGYITIRSAVNGQLLDEFTVFQRGCDVLDIQTFKLFGVAFSCDSSGSLCAFSDRPDSVNMMELESNWKGLSPKFCRVANDCNILVVFHTGLGLTFYRLKTTKGSPPGFLGYHFLTEDAKKKPAENNGEVYCAAVFRNLLCLADSTAHVRMFLLPTDVMSTNVVPLMTWINNSKWDISSMSFAHSLDCLVLGNASGTIFWYRVPDSEREPACEGTPLTKTVNLDTSYLFGSSERKAEPTLLSFVGKKLCDMTSRVSGVLPVDDFGLIFLNFMDRMVPAFPLSPHSKMHLTKNNDGGASDRRKRAETEALLTSGSSKMLQEISSPRTKTLGSSPQSPLKISTSPNEDSDNPLRGHQIGVLSLDRTDYSLSSNEVKVLLKECQSLRNIHAFVSPEPSPAKAQHHSVVEQGGNAPMDATQELKNTSFHSSSGQGTLSRTNVTFHDIGGLAFEDDTNADDDPESQRHPLVLVEDLRAFYQSMEDARSGQLKPSFGTLGLEPTFSTEFTFQLSALNERSRATFLPEETSPTNTLSKNRSSSRMFTDRRRSVAPNRSSSVWSDQSSYEHVIEVGAGPAPPKRLPPRKLPNTVPVPDAIRSAISGTAPTVVLPIPEIHTPAIDHTKKSKPLRHMTERERREQSRKLNEHFHSLTVQRAHRSECPRGCEDETVRPEISDDLVKHFLDEETKSEVRLREMMRQKMESVHGDEIFSDVLLTAEHRKREKLAMSVPNLQEGLFPKTTAGKSLRKLNTVLTTIQNEKGSLDDISRSPEANDFRVGVVTPLPRATTPSITDPRGSSVRASTPQVNRNPFDSRRTSLMQRGALLPNFSDLSLKMPQRSASTPLKPNRSRTPSAVNEGLAVLQGSPALQHHRGIQ